MYTINSISIKYSYEHLRIHSVNKFIEQKQIKEFARSFFSNLLDDPDFEIKLSFSIPSDILLYKLRTISNPEPEGLSIDQFLPDNYVSDRSIDQIEFDFTETSFFRIIIHSFADIYTAHAFVYKVLPTFHKDIAYSKQSYNEILPLSLIVNAVVEYVDFEINEELSEDFSDINTVVIPNVEIQAFASEFETRINQLVHARLRKYVADNQVLIEKYPSLHLTDQEQSLLNIIN